MTKFIIRTNVYVITVQDYSILEQVGYYPKAGRPSTVLFICSLILCIVSLKIWQLWQLKSVNINACKK